MFTQHNYGHTIRSMLLVLVATISVQVFGYCTESGVPLIVKQVRLANGDMFSVLKRSDTKTELLAMWKKGDSTGTVVTNELGISSHIEAVAHNGKWFAWAQNKESGFDAYVGDLRGRKVKHPDALREEWSLIYPAHLLPHTGLLFTVRYTGEYTLEYALLDTFENRPIKGPIESSTQIVQSASNDYRLEDTSTFIILEMSDVSERNTQISLVRVDPFTILESKSISGRLKYVQNGLSLGDYTILDSYSMKLWLVQTRDAESRPVLEVTVIGDFSGVEPRPIHLGEALLDLEDDFVCLRRFDSSYQFLDGIHVDLPNPSEKFFAYDGNILVAYNQGGSEVYVTTILDEMPSFARRKFRLIEADNSIVTIEP